MAALSMSKSKKYCHFTKWLVNTYGAISLNIGPPKVKMMFSAIKIAIVPTMGPIGLFTKEEIIIDNDATTSIERHPEQKA